VRAVERIWYGRDAGAALVRAALTPSALVFRSLVRLRNWAYDAGLRRSLEPALPAVSIGNLSVGGTGKTPVAAYVARQLQGAGGRPCIVMRGVGDDESRAYERLAPGVPVVTDGDRVRGISAAAQRACNIAVLDDAFQHRRVRRALDIVLLSADRRADGQTLPAGPWREPLAALRRAHLVGITRKAVRREVAEQLASVIARKFPALPVVQFALLADELVAWRNEARRPTQVLAQARVLLIAGVGDGMAFVRQIESTGAHVTPVMFRDHARYSVLDAEQLAARAVAHEITLCTLKDAVKLGPLWPRQAPELWYVSQRLEVERGAEVLQRMLARVLDLTSSRYPPP
jgi:tetraacyldisaccharide 4'-kinase